MKDFVITAKKDENIILVDASNLGKKIKDNGIQRTILTPENISLIENTFLNKDQIDDFSIIVRKNDIISKKYSADLNFQICGLSKQEYMC